MKYADIKVQQCADPLTCRKCLVICPTTVFIVGNTMVYKFRETPKKEFKVYGRYYDRCTGCMECVKVCPEKAIQIEIKEMEASAPAGGKAA